MDKFQVGDRIVQDATGRMATVIRRFDNGVYDESYLIKTSWSETLLYNIGAWSVVDEADKLPEMPSSVVYRSTSHELEVCNNHTSYGDVFIGLRHEDRQDPFMGLHLTADEALQLSHDILRYAMIAKREREE